MNACLVAAIREAVGIVDLVERRLSLLDDSTSKIHYTLSRANSVAELSRVLKNKNASVLLLDQEMFNEAHELDLLANPGDLDAPLILVWARQRQEVPSDVLARLVEYGGMLAEFTETTPELIDVYLTFVKNMLQQRALRSERLELLVQSMGGDFGSVFSSVLDSLAEGVGCSDKDGNLIYANPAFEEITGFDFTEVKGKKVYDFWFSSEMADLENAITEQEERNRRRLSGKNEEYELVIARKDGERRRIEVHASPLRNSSGSIVGSIGVVSDVTERRSLEEQLLWSQKLEAVGRLAGSVAHDFNNLLTVISGYSNMIIKRLRKEDPSYRQVSAIQQASEIASALTSQLLTLSRRQVVEATNIDLSKGVVAVIDLIKGLLGTKVQLELDIAEAETCIRFDKGQLEQVILNLSVNARDAMPSGGRLRISTTTTTVADGSELSRLLPLGKYHVLEVSDTGVGMTPHVKKKLFEPFFSTKEGGSGLGLSTVYSVVHQHGGVVAVDSEEGVGTTFRVYYPAVIQLKAVGVEHGELSTSGDVTNVTTVEQERKVLVVEDEEAVRELVVDILSDSGYQVVATSDAFEAIELLRSEKICPSLMVTDIVMPGMDGIELASEVKKMYPDLPILAMSGCSHEAIVNERILHSTIPFIAKPFEPGALLSKVQEVLNIPEEKQKTSGKSPKSLLVNE